MSQQRNITIARELLDGIGGGRDPAAIAALFDADLVFEIQGDDGVLPWIGRKTGRAAVADFIRDIRALTEPLAFDVEDILASDSRAAIIGALRTRIKATGKITATQFAIILTIAGRQLRRLQGGPGLRLRCRPGGSVQASAAGKSVERLVPRQARSSASRASSVRSARAKASRPSTSRKGGLSVNETAMIARAARSGSPGCLPS